MRIIISPAKKMRIDTDTMPWKDLPCFIEKAEVLYKKLQSMSNVELQKLWHCNDTIADENVARLKYSNLRINLTPALLAYKGIQYQYMASNVFTWDEYEYLQEHLRILSGLYGILRPLDGVIPYRLEMQARLKICDAKNLYAYWGSLIADKICSESNCIINLASKEYSLCVSPFLKPGVSMIHCVFGEEQAGKVIEKGTLCKMARGEMVRYLAENHVERPGDLKDFSRLNYCFSPQYSDSTHFVFLNTKKGDRTAWPIS